MQNNEKTNNQHISDKLHELNERFKDLTSTYHKIQSMIKDILPSLDDDTQVLVAITLLNDLQNFASTILTDMRKHITKEIEDNDTHAD